MKLTKQGWDLFSYTVFMVFVYVYQNIFCYILEQIAAVSDKVPIVGPVGAYVLRLPSKIKL